MGKYLLGLLLIPSAVSSQQSLNNMQLPVVCGMTVDVVAAINKFEEKVIFYGTNDGGSVSLWYNGETNTFTITKGSKNGTVSCVIADGIKKDNI